jgi:2-(1,2-epoxy-1,2-dihydrophenyl)acetyl-CoA isomerase
MLDGLVTVLLDICGSVARLTLNRPQKLNCFTSEMHRELRQALTAIEGQAQAGGGRALLITGAGRAFCAGQDLSERRRDPNDPPLDLERSLLENYNPLITRLGLFADPGRRCGERRGGGQRSQPSAGL